ncbi:MAG: hypothetical protein C0425_11620 [Chlorobiaceae bacterium]|nr:hypothetical protein [Chlorobiaceae bacterium]MBA4310963.1 hypothetical protein [Chlorobiaceae bacterium]
MKIETNSLGNYKPLTTPSDASKVASLNKPKEELGKITNEEKNFFTNLYPSNKEEIMSYHFYQRDGKMSGVSLGSIINRRG